MLDYHVGFLRLQTLTGHGPSAELSTQVSALIVVLCVALIIVHTSRETFWTDLSQDFTIFW